MPAKVSKIRETGGTVIIHKCEICGNDASFGHSVDLMRSLSSLDKGYVDTAKIHLGKWYCYQHNMRK